MLRRHRGDMCVVMLDLDHPVEGHLLRDPGGEIPWMPIPYADFRVDIEEDPEPLQRGLEVAQGLQILEIADVLAHVHALPMNQGEGVLEVRAHRHEGDRGGERETDGERSEAPSTAEEDRRLVHNPHDRVVVARHDLPVVEEKRVGDGTQALDSFLIGDGDGLLAGVSTGHDQGPAHPAEKEEVQRGIGGHHPDRIQTRGHGGYQPTPRPRLQHHDGSFRGGEESGLLPAHLAEVLGLAQATHHHR